MRGRRLSLFSLAVSAVLFLPVASPWACANVELYRGAV